MKLTLNPSASPTGAQDDQACLEVAAQWIVGLSDDDPARREAARAGFEAWKRAHPGHGAMAAAMENLVEQTRDLGAPPGVGQGGRNGLRQARQAARGALDSLLREECPSKAARPTDRPAARIKGRAGLLALLLGFPLALALALQAYSPAVLLADLRTAPGEQRVFVLDDGSRLTLSTASAVNVSMEAGLRRVELLEGEILVDVARNPGRPFQVETGQGRIRALGTRFIVRQEADWTRLSMLESRTAVRARTNTAGAEAGAEGELTVSAGQSVRLSPRGLEMLNAINPDMAGEAFIHRRLVVRDQPLPEVLDELARHRSGFILYERAALQGLRVTAVLPLDDTGRALQLLANSFTQLRIHRVTPLLVIVEAEPG